MYEFLDYRVHDAMTEDPITVRPQQTLAEVEGIFEERDFNGLPVVDDEGELLGLITQLDLLRAFRFNDEHMFPPYEEIMRSSVESVMGRDVRTITPRARLTRVLETLVRTGFKSLVVVVDHRPVGMISREDIRRALRKAAAGQSAGAISRELPSRG